MNLNLTLLILFFLAAAILLVIGFLAWFHRRVRGSLLKASLVGAAFVTVAYTLLAQLVYYVADSYVSLGSCDEDCPDSLLAHAVGGIAAFAVWFLVALVVGFLTRRVRTNRV